MTGKEIIRLRGIGVSPGIAMGRALLQKSMAFDVKKETVPPDGTGHEVERLKSAVDRTRLELTRIRDDIRDKMGEESSFIFDAHLMILDDPSLFESLETIIRKEGARSEWALARVNNRYGEIFDSIADEYFRQRKSDVFDVLSRIYRNLSGDEEQAGRADTSHIIVAHELLPSEAALRLVPGATLGIALDMGGQTSHTAILARSLNIPAVLGLRELTRLAREGDFLIVDGTDGEVIINPSPAVRKEFLAKKEKYEKYRRELKKTALLEPVTLDGVRFSLLANIEMQEELRSAFALGAEGVGLFRSEFIYLQRSTLPDEDDHLRVYQRLAREAYPRPVYIRTLDIGGEKSLPQLNIERESNPALGLRAVRFSLQNRALFRTQLRAMVRASRQGNVRVLIPMVTELEEVIEVKEIFEDVKRELAAAGEPVDRELPFGIMIEVPSSAALVDVLLKDVDYVSIGTNDLIQYFLAVDRSNELVSYLYKPFHPGLLRLVRNVIQSAVAAEKEVTVCGEMAADPLSAILMLGFGLRVFSMNPIFIPRVKRALRLIEARTAEKIAVEAMKLRSAQEIEEYVIEEILVKHPEVFLGAAPLPNRVRGRSGGGPNSFHSHP
jgi:phosphotransferase system enzyme I (PtsI)